MALRFELAEEPINVALRNLICRVIALGLNGIGRAVFVLKDKIDAAVSAPAPWIVVPQPDLVDLSGPFWVFGKEPLHEAFELLPTLVGVGMQRANKSFE